jgi:hypothetical protein
MRARLQRNGVRQPRWTRRVRTVFRHEDRRAQRHPTSASVVVYGERTLASPRPLNLNERALASLCLVSGVQLPPLARSRSSFCFPDRATALAMRASARPGRRTLRPLQEQAAGPRRADLWFATRGETGPGNPVSSRSPRPTQEADASVREAKSIRSRDHRGWSRVDRVDDLGVVDSAQVDGGDPEVGMS